jgi:hypothetical protein
MNNKFIRFLLILNGILIPLFILTCFGLFLSDTVDFPSKETSVFDDIDNSRFTIKFTRPQEIPNSTNYFVSKYRSVEMNEIIGEPELAIGEVQENTVNIVFLNEDFEKIGNLLNRDGSISQIFISNYFQAKQDDMAPTKHIAYLIAEEDSNQDGVIDRFDEHHLYISNLDGRHLTLVIDKKVKHFKFINNSKEIMITYFDKVGDLGVGVYNIESKKFDEKINLSSE